MENYKYRLGNIAYLITADENIIKYLNYRVPDIKVATDDLYDVKVDVSCIDVKCINVSDKKFINQQEPDISDAFFYREIQDLGTFKYDRKRKELKVQYIDSKLYPYDSNEVVVDTILQFIYLIMLEFLIIPLHTAVLTENHRAVMLFGNSGAGKSTLELALLCSGMQYYADDIAFMNADDTVFGSKERILGCTKETQILIQECFNQSFQVKNSYSSVNKQILAIDENSISNEENVIPYIIVFPQKNQYDSGLYEVPSKEVFVRLMEMTISEKFSTEQKQLYFKRLKNLSKKVLAYEYCWNTDSRNIKEVCNKIKSMCEKGVIK